MLDLLGPVVIVCAVMLLASTSLVAVRPEMPDWLVQILLSAGGAVGIVATAVWLPGRNPLSGVAAAVALVVAAAWYTARRTDVHAPAAALWTGMLAFFAATGLWGLAFLAELSLSATTTVLAWTLVGLVAATVPSALVTLREGWEPLLRRSWTRPRTTLPADVVGHWPRVSIHVPCHAEPPDVVIATLDRLAALDYPDFEVVVVDNNTTDAELWQPVRARCRELGAAFRFLHVEGLTGAKAGALNYALAHTDRTAELVAVVDADYQVTPDWLRETVGHFADPRMGFVQGPHAYRDYEDTRFGRWANWEYSVFFNAGMVSLNEHNAGLTVGTMSLIRKDALERAGGWATWCLTEDSELAIRIHAAGYDSVYLTRPYGRGLIPQTFSSYRRQRFRWTFGPVQELRRHWRLFVPRALGGRPSELTRRQKLHHANHGIDVIGVGVRALAVPLAVATAVSMAVHHERVAMPVELWAASTSGLLTSVLVRYLVYRRVVGATLRQALGGVVAFASLWLVIASASLRATSGGHSSWHRTPKFAARRRGVRVLREAAVESVASLCLAAGAVGMFVLLPWGGVMTMLAIACAVQALTLAAAPLAAVTADRSIAARRKYAPAHAATRSDLAA